MIAFRGHRRALPEGMPAAQVVLPLLISAIGPDTTPADLTVLVEYPGRGRPPGLSIVQKEIQRLLAPLGMRVEMQWYRRGDTVGVRRMIVVATLRGDCVSAMDGPLPANARILGWTHITEGQVLPFVEVDCDRVRAVIRRGLGLAQRPLGALVFAQAVARVMAHEIFHVVARTGWHAQRGVAKPMLDCGDLTDSSNSFDDKALDQMRCAAEDGSHSADCRSQ